MIRNKKIAITIYLISIMQMSAMAMSSALSSISEAFPYAGDTTVQMVMSLPALFMGIASLISGKLSERIPKKWLITASAVLIIGGAFGGLLIHGNIYILLVWAAVLGFGMGLFVPINAGLIALFFSGHEREIVSGQQVTASTIGGVCLSMIAGFLCETGWSRVYLIFFAIIPGWICSQFFLPRESISSLKAEAEATDNGGKAHISRGSWVFIIVMFLFISMYNIIPNNLSMYITEKSLGGSAEAGTATALFLLGGAFSGIIYGYIAKYLRDMIITLSFALLIAAGGILFLTANLGVLYVTVVFAGFSVGFVMAQCTCRIAEIESRAGVTLAMSVMLAFNCLGQCIAPLFTKLSSAVFHTDACVYRFLLVIILGTVFMVISIIMMKSVKEKNVN